MPIYIFFITKILCTNSKLASQKKSSILITFACLCIEYKNTEKVIHPIDTNRNLALKVSIETTVQFFCIL